MPTVIESLELRQLLTFVALDPNFGDGGKSRPVVRPSLEQSAGATQVTPLKDGRIITTDRAAIRYLRADGGADEARADGGIRVLPKTSAAIVGVAVDAGSGRVAVLRRVTSASGTVELYSAKGKRIATRAITLSPDAKLAFRDDGKLLVASTRTEAASNASARAVEIRLYDLVLSRDMTFGSAGVASLYYGSPPSGTDEAANPTRIESLKVDATGRSYVVTRAASTVERLGDYRGPNVIEKVEVRRFTVAGAADAAYNLRPVLARASTTTMHVQRLAFTDAAVTADGTFYGLVSYVEYSPFDTTFSRPNNPSLTLSRRGSDGATSQRSDLGRTPTSFASTGQVAIGYDGSVFVTTPGGGRLTQFYQLNGKTLADNPHWSDFGSYASTSSDVEARDLAVTSDRRLLVTTATPAVIAYQGTKDEFWNVQPNTARLFADGTLVARGSGGNDTIQVRRRADDVLVEINGRTFKFPGSFTEVRGVLVQGGFGNDRLEVATSATQHFAVYMEGGDGADTMVGGARSDTLVGGNGRDSLLGNEGNDFLYGQNEIDTVVGGAGKDLIYGGRDNDVLVASVMSLDPVDDGERDAVFGNSGIDTFHLDDYSALGDKDQTDGHRDEPGVQFDDPDGR